MGSVDEVDGGSCDSGDDAEIAVQWEASMKLTVGAVTAVMMQRSLSSGYRSRVLLAVMAEW